MTNFPAPEKSKIPEGHYSFRVNREPDLMVIEVKGQDGNPKKSRKIVLYVIGINPTGEYLHSEGFVPWDERYADLLAALGVEHGRDIDITGTIFEADIEHVQDKKDAAKFWPRLKNLLPQGKAPVTDADIDGDIPF